MAHQELPDLILMDMSLPILDGWEATRQIRANAITQKIPVIALTAHAMAGDREKALAVGCNEYETKPVEFQRLLNKIELLVNHKSL
jgi:CheY-like chemotaxis protein